MFCNHALTAPWTGSVLGFLCFTISAKQNSILDSCLAAVQNQFPRQIDRWRELNQPLVRDWCVTMCAPVQRNEPVWLCQKYPLCFAEIGFMMEDEGVIYFWLTPAHTNLNYTHSFFYSTYWNYVNCIFFFMLNLDLWTLSSVCEWSALAETKTYRHPFDCFLVFNTEA